MTLFLNKKCDWEGCLNPQGPSHFIFGKGYCPQHYNPALEKHFLEEFEKWDGAQSPNKKFLSLFRRYIESIYEKAIPTKLNPTRFEKINKNGIFNLRKTKVGIDFDIIRHPYAITNPLKMREKHQRWRFNIKIKKLRLLKSKRKAVQQ